MIILTKTSTRPSVNVPFYRDTVDNSLFKSYNASGIRFNASNTLSPDGLTLSHESFWIDKDVYLEKRNSPEFVAYVQNKDAYNTLMGIVETPTVIEEF